MLKINATELLNLRNTILSEKFKKDLDSQIEKVTNYFGNTDNLLKDVPNISLQFEFLQNKEKLKSQLIENSFVVEDISNLVINVSLPLDCFSPETTETVKSEPLAPEIVKVTVSPEIKATPSPYMHGDIMSHGPPF